MTVETFEQPARGDQSKKARIFRAVVGGFGYLGVVTRIRYRLLDASSLMSGGKALQVRSTLETVEGFDELVRLQLERTRQTRYDFEHDLEEQDFEDYVTEEDPAIYGVGFFEGGDGKGIVYRSTYTSGQEDNPYLVFNRDSVGRILSGLFATFRWTFEIGQKIFWKDAIKDDEENEVFVQDAEEWHFFQDANVTKKRLGEALGLRMPVIQQTFVVPTDVSDDFLGDLPELCRDEYDVLPTLLDVLYMPKDDILMSASRGIEGFACTLAFEDIRYASRRDRTVQAMMKLSERCLDFGGRVHFTKNVYTAPDILGKMYEHQLPAFLELKAELDPDGLLRNGFYDRCFAQPAAALGLL
jgi:hypothetical protein